jgi:hypothetical protein
MGWRCDAKRDRGRVLFGSAWFGFGKARDVLNGKE